MPSRMKLAKTSIFLLHFNKFMEILLFVLKFMYISLLPKIINGFSWPAKIMVSPSKLYHEWLSSSTKKQFSQLFCLQSPICPRLWNSTGNQIFSCSYMYILVKLRGKTKWHIYILGTQKVQPRLTLVFPTICVIHSICVQKHKLPFVH